ncbi:MAG: hypothetical protein RL757_2870 [Bacteroidota bacterium]
MTYFLLRLFYSLFYFFFNTIIQKRTQKCYPPVSKPFFFEFRKGGKIFTDFPSRYWGVAFFLIRKAKRPCPSVRMSSKF